MYLKTKEPDALAQELLVSPETLSYEEHKRLESILLLDADAPFRVAPWTCREIAQLLLDAKRARADAALCKEQTVASAKPKSDGKNRTAVFIEEDERRRECAEAGVAWAPLSHNAWAFRRP
jgi:hypothetical protein